MPRKKKIESDAPTPPKSESGALALPTALEQELAPEMVKAEASLELARRIPVGTPAGRELAAKIVRMARARVEQLEEQRTSVTGPMLEAKRRVDSWFKPLREKYEQIANEVDTALKSDLWQSRQTKDQALCEIQAGAGHAPAEVLARAHAPEPVLPVGVLAREEFELVSIDMRTLPDGFKLADESAIKRALKAGQSVPGVVFRQVLGLTYRKESI